MKNMTTEIKNLISKRLFIAEERSSELGNSSEEIYSECDKEMKNIGSRKIQGCLLEFQKKRHIIFQEITAKTFTNWIKDPNPQIQDICKSGA